MKRRLAILMAAGLMIMAAGCGRGAGLYERGTSEKNNTQAEGMDETGMKVGFLFPSAADVTDTISHVAGIREMQYETGLEDSQVIIRSDVDKDDYEAVIESMAEEGCNLIFAKSSDSEKAMLAAAKKYPEIQFCQENGKKAKKSGLSNMHNFYVRLYEAYYAAGVAAGMKLNQMLNAGRISSDTCVIGFAATRENAENISCINAFSLGVKRVCSQASMLVRYVNSKGVYDDDGECARQLAAAGAKLMCQRTFTTAVAAVCAESDIPMVGNEINMINVAPDEALASAVADWGIYYAYAVNCLLSGEEIDTDWCAGYKEGAVILSQMNDRILADGTISQVADVEKKLRSGKIQVFRTEDFTVDGQDLASLVKEDNDYKKYRKYIKNEVYRESVTRSAPSMEFLIDGISVITGDYLSDDEEENDSYYSN